MESWWILREEQAKEWFDYNLSRENSVVTDLFAGQFFTQVQCSKCQNIEGSFDNFWSVLLQFSPKLGAMKVYSENLVKMIESTEKMDQIPDVICGKCKKKTTLHKQTSFFKMPPILCLVFKRFRVSSWMREKNSTEVHIPLILDFNEINLANLKKGPQYELVGVVNHSGSLYSGHYTRYSFPLKLLFKMEFLGFSAKSECKNNENKKWYRFNDESCSQSSGMGELSFKSSSAYILFYSRI